MSRRLFPFFLVLMMFCPLTRAQDTSAQREQKEKLEKEIELINKQLSSADIFETERNKCPAGELRHTLRPL